MQESLQEYLKEEWKPITLEGCGERYLVSNYSRVYDKEKERYVAQVITGKPQYFYVNLNVGKGKRILRRVHNIMLRAFKPEDHQEGFVVDHKDRNKFNNSLDNLRWVSKTGNALNKENTLYFKGMLLVDYCRRYYPDSYEQVKPYIYSKMNTCTEDNIILQLDRHLQYGVIGNEKIFIKNKEYYLLDLLEKYQVSLEEYREKTTRGFSVEGILLQHKHFLPVDKQFGNSVELPEDSITGVWFSSKKQLAEDLGYTSRECLETREKNGCTTYTDYKTFTPDPTYTVDGFTGTLRELATKYGISYETVKDRVSSKGWSVEDAVKTKKLKIKHYLLNGERMTRKAVIETLLPHKSYPSVSTRQSHKKCTMEENLEHFGVDLSTIKLEACI